MAWPAHTPPVIFPSPSSIQSDPMSALPFSRAPFLYLSALLAVAACDREADIPEAAASTPTAYMTHRNWGVLPPGREWGRVSGVYIDPNGTDVWAFERCGGDNCIASDEPASSKVALSA